MHGLLTLVETDPGQLIPLTSYRAGNELSDTGHKDSFRSCGVDLVATAANAETDQRQNA